MSLQIKSLPKAHLEFGKTWVAYLPALLLLPVVLAPPLNHDVAANLDFTQRWIGGEALYSRLLTTDPPLIFVLNLLPAYVGKYTALGAILALQLCVLFYGAVVWWLTVRLRRHSEEGPIEWHFLNVAPVLVLVGAGYDFGQREHLMVLGALPYLFLATRRARGAQDSYRYIVAILAAVTFAIKPYFLGIPALVELYLLFTLGWRLYMRDPVPWAMAAVWVIYLASLPVFFLDYLDIMLPLIFKYYVGGHTLWQTILVPRMGTALVLLAPLLWLAFRGKNVVAKILSFAAMGAAVSALIQRKGWSYHIVPIELFGCVLAGTLASRWLDMRNSNLHKYSQSIAFGLSMLFVLFVISSGEAPWRELGYANAHEQTELKALLIQSAPDARVLVLSPRVWPIYPALNYAHSHQTLPAINIWVLQGVYGECLPDGRLYRDIGEMSWAERTVFETVAEEFAADPPKVVVIDQITGMALCGNQFNLLEYFKRHPRFASTWSRYAFFAESNGLDLYRRVEGSTGVTAR
ncbi:MAG: hypothetical protein ABSD08_13670 [Xanthobacteraceae bacterium]